MEMIRGKDMLYLSQGDIKSMGITMPQMIDLVEKVYTEKGNGRWAMPAKIALHTLPDKFPGDFLHAMPAMLPGLNAAGMKWVGGYENARLLGYPYISGLYILNDIETGIPMSIMDCIWITTYRTGAVTGLTAKYLANPDSEVAGLIGTGVQGRVNVEALSYTMPNLKEVRFFDHIDAAAEAYQAEMSERFPQITFKRVAKREDAVVDCDLLLSCVPCSVEPGIEFIEPDMIKKGATALPVDDLVLYKPETVGGDTFDKKYTDDQGQFDHFQSMGFFRTFKKTPEELGEAIIGKVARRESHDEKILTVNIGTGLCDVGSARFLYDMALEKGIGTKLAL